MTYRNLIIPLAMAVSVAACGNSSDAAHASTSAATDVGVCLRQHTAKLDALLTKSDITPYVRGAATDVEVDYDTKYSHTITYSWPSQGAVTSKPV